MNIRILIAVLFVAIVTSCRKEPTALSTGSWRGIIRMQNMDLPFNFDVTDSGKYAVYLKNGSERLLLDEVSIQDDSVIMKLHIFDAALRAHVEDGKLTGWFVRNYAPNYKFPFSATFNENFRFEKEGPASVDYSGTYAVKFFSDKDTTVSVGVFAQEDNLVTGTFLRPDGDFRYLEGNVIDGKLYLSTFDGNHAYIFTATKSGNNLHGDFFAGMSSHETWTGVLDPKAKLPDVEALTYLKPGYEKIEFTFPDLNKKNVSLSDPKYKNKVVILQIFGTWCPNCMDETRFLAPWYEKNKSRGVEIIGLAYERKEDFQYAKQRVEVMKEKMGVGYDFVIAGINDKEKAAQTLPALNKVIAFPTTIFIGRDGKVKKIYTGFSGPGTGKYYDEYVEHFDQLVNDLLQGHVLAKR